MLFHTREYNMKVLQISVVSSIVYYLTAYPVVFESAKKFLPFNFTKKNHLLLFHTFVFGVVMFILTYFVFSPFLHIFEGTNVTRRGKKKDSRLHRYKR